uniref:Uncharacterized protein n=1 Tax=Rhizophora mucronata TaxID=61149 RepID=A0A2P2JIE5_RHIMU
MIFQLRSSVEHTQMVKVRKSTFHCG